MSLFLPGCYAIPTFAPRFWGLLQELGVPKLINMILRSSSVKRSFRKPFVFFLFFFTLRKSRVVFFLHGLVHNLSGYKYIIYTHGTVV